MRTIVILFISLFLTGVVSAADDKLMRPIAEPAAAPDFNMLDYQDNSHTLAGYKDTVLIVNFWATWCPPCIKEMPSLQNTWRQLQEHGFQVLGINMGDDKEAVAKFAEEYQIEFPLLLDENMESAPAWSIKGLPTTHIVDGQGRIVYTVLGDKEWDDPDLVNQIRQVKAAMQN